MLFATPIRRTLAVALVLVVFLWPSHNARAQENNLVPEFNPLCWRLEDCARQRSLISRIPYEQMSDDQKKAGWVTGETPCNQSGWGKCLPAGTTRTEIIFGGKQQFANVGEFIQLMYRYAVGIASILSVIMIMVAGFQYVTSGGNSEALSSAKKRMAGAFSGLILAFLSYAILTLINPALTRFRLPQIWMIRQQHLIPQFCSEASSTVFALAAESTDQASKLTATPDFTKGMQYQGDNIKQFTCGRRFYIKDGGGQACFGDVCPANQMCSNVDYSGNVGTYNCIQASILGKITNESPFPFHACVLGYTVGVRYWEKPEIVDTGTFNASNHGSEQELWMVCKDNSISEVDVSISKTFILSDYQTYYMALADSQIDGAVNLCKDKGGEKGFVLKFEMNRGCGWNDENHWIGYEGNSSGRMHTALDLGDDAFFKNGNQLADKGKQINPKYFIPSTLLKSGMVLDVDATKIQYTNNSGENYSAYDALLSGN